MPKVWSFEVSDVHKEYLEEEKLHHGMSIPQLLRSLIKADMERKQDRQRPVFQLQQHYPVIPNPSHVSLPTGKPPVSPPSMFKPLSEMSEEEQTEALKNPAMAKASINSEFKKLIAEGKIKKRRAWKPKKKKVKE